MFDTMFNSAKPAANSPGYVPTEIGHFFREVHRITIREILGEEIARKLA